MQGVCFLYISVETYLVRPLRKILSLIRNRFVFGIAARQIDYVTNIEEVKYVGGNGEVYTIIQDPARFDQYIFDASWTPDGKTFIDVTDVLRSLCGPMGNMHGYLLNLERFSGYLANTREDCDLPFTENLKLTWTSSRDLTTYEVTDLEQILDFDQ